MGCSTVAFIDHSGAGSNLPNPKFIAIHAAITHILKLSGAGKVLDELWEKFFGEDCEVLDGKTRSVGDLELRMSAMDLAHLTTSF